VTKDQLKSLFDLTGRVALVTGGTRGIGRSIAEGYALAGAKVVVAGRKAGACQEAEVHLRGMTGGEALAVPTHMGDLDSVNALVERTVERFGRIDVIVNNAATSLAQPLGEFTSEAWAKVFDVDLRGPVFLVQAALPQLKASSAASVINMSSIGAFTFSAGVSMYAAAKAGLQAFTRSMAAAYAPFDIRVNALCPGSVDTDMTRSAGPESMAHMAASCLQNRIADPDEMVGPALFLAGGASSYMTGQVLICDGGYLSH
jgi:NAD(P)-dependent dehydrogenase (short-subunit alcohol dehydrogenase family)